MILPERHVFMGNTYFMEKLFPCLETICLRVKKEQITFLNI